MKRIIHGCAVVLVAALAGCGGGSGGGGGDPPPTPTGPNNPSPPATGVVTVRLTAGLNFSPAEVVIAPGATIRWVNEAAMTHTITPDDLNQSGAWASRTVTAAGETFEQTFQAVGDYPYHCNPHAGSMRGTIRVRTS